jgi:Ras-related protein Rab-2A
MTNENTFKYIIVGDSGVGKSCLMIKFINNKFNTIHDLTITVDFGIYIHKINNDDIKIQIWDTAGQESFRSITRSYYRGALVSIIVFDITNKKSFENIKNWYRDIIENTTDNIIILVGNKIDLENHRTVSFEEAMLFASSNNMKYYETSAKDKTNINNIFIDPANEIYDKFNKKILIEKKIVKTKKKCRC